MPFQHDAVSTVGFVSYCTDAWLWWFSWRQQKRLKILRWRHMIQSWRGVQIWIVVIVALKEYYTDVPLRHDDKILGYNVQEVCQPRRVVFVDCPTPIKVALLQELGWNTTRTLMKQVVTRNFGCRKWCQKKNFSCRNYAYVLLGHWINFLHGLLLRVLWFKRNYARPWRI